MTTKTPCSQYRADTHRCASGFPRIFGVCMGMPSEPRACEHCGSVDEKTLPYCMRDEPPPHLTQENGLPIGWPKSHIERQEAQPMTITPETVERSAEGAWSHSAWDALFDDRDHITAEELDAWCETHQIIVETRTLDDDPDSPLIAQLEACEPVDLSAWPLQPPSEDPGWFLLAIIDTEDGPVQTWAYSDTKATEGTDG